MDNKTPAPAPKPDEKQADKADAALTKAKATQTLVFQNLAGVDEDRVVNTFRVGKKWADRVAVGDIVNLAKLDEDGKEEVIGTAEITGVVTGPWSDVKALAADNHAFGKLPVREAETMLHDELGRIYEGEFRSNSVLTVLYLKPVSGDKK